MKPDAVILNPDGTVPDNAVAPDYRPSTLGVYDPAGRPLADDAIADALSSGEARFDMDREYHLLDAGGLPKIVRGEHVWNAISQGWALEPTEARELRKARENATLLDTIGAGAIGVGESLTLGTLPAIVEDFGGQDAIRDYKLARGASPEAASVGEVLGLLTPIGLEGLAAKGLGTVSKVGRGAMVAGETAAIAPRAVSRVARGAGEAVVGALPQATTALGRVTRQGIKFGAEGAVEGAAYATGHAIGEASLGDEELTAERLLAAAGGGALLGATIGGGLGVAAGAPSVIAERLGPGALEGFAERQAWKAIGASNDLTRRVGLDEAKRSGRRVLDEGLLKFEGAETRAASLREAAREAGEQVIKLAEKIDGAGARPNVAPIVEKLDETLGELRKGVGADVELAKKVDRDFGNWFRDRAVPGSEATFKELTATRASINDELERAIAAKDTRRTAAYGELRAVVDDQINRQTAAIAPKIGDDFLNDYAVARARHQELLNAAEAAETAASAGGPLLSPDNALALGALAFAGPKGLLAAGANKLAREHGRAATARLADALAKSGRPPSVAEVLGGRLSVADALGDGLPTPGPASAAAEVRGRLDAVNDLKKKADNVALSMAAGVREAVKASATSIPRTAARAGTYEALAADAREHRSAPERTAFKVAARTEPVINAAPNVARAVTAKATGDIDYLSRQLPSTGAAATPAQQKAIQPSSSESASFVRKARAIENPQSAVFDMKNGRLSSEAVAALRERRPMLLSKIIEEAEQVYAELIRAGKVPDRQARLQLETLTGRPADAASNPLVVSVVQQAYAEQAAAMAAPPLATPSTPSKRADRMMSESEAIARGDE
jgi:hypothetical protein